MDKNKDPISNKTANHMLDRFVQSLATANDSGTFDTSLEFKPLLCRKKSKCVTELDREDLEQFVHEFETRKTNNIAVTDNQFQNSSDASTPLKLATEHELPETLKSVQNIVELLEKELPLLTLSSVPDQRTVIGSSSENCSISLQSLPTSPLLQPKNNSSSMSAETISTDSDFGSHEEFYVDGEYQQEIDKNSNQDDSNIDADLTSLDQTIYKAKTPENQMKNPIIPSTSFSFKKPFNDITNNQCKLQNCKSAKVLQFFSSAGKKVRDHLRPTSCNNSRNSSPVLLRAKHLGVKPLSDSEDEDDGIHINDSRDISPDSSFEMQPPLVPKFKVTPNSNFRHGGNPAYELARILRGSFHRTSLRTKRACISTLKRSSSNPDLNKLNGNFKKTKEASPDPVTTPKIKNNNEKIYQNDNQDLKFIKAKYMASDKCKLGAAFVRNLDVLCVSNEEIYINFNSYTKLTKNSTKNKPVKVTKF